MKTMLHYAAIGILLAGCNGKHAGNAAGSAVSAPAGAGFDAVTLERSACYGFCPVYTVDVHADGTVKYVGKEHVAVAGVRDGRITAADVARLGAMLRQSHLERMRDTYRSKADGCAETPTDQSSLTIAVTTAGKTKTISWYGGCRGPTVPADTLTALAGTIDEVARSAPLIKPQAGAAR